MLVGKSPPLRTGVTIGYRMFPITLDTDDPVLFYIDNYATVRNADTAIRLHATHWIHRRIVALDYKRASHE